MDNEKKSAAVGGTPSPAEAATRRLWAVDASAVLIESVTPSPASATSDRTRGGNTRPPLNRLQPHRGAGARHPR